jgi:hypothetical protein
LCRFNYPKIFYLYVGNGILGSVGLGGTGVAVWGWNPSVAECVGEG